MTVTKILVAYYECDMGYTMFQKITLPCTHCNLFYQYAKYGDKHERGFCFNPILMRRCEGIRCGVFSVPTRAHPTCEPTGGDVSTADMKQSVRALFKNVLQMHPVPLHVTWRRFCSVIHDLALVFSDN